MKYDTYRGVFNTDLLAGNVSAGEYGLPTIFRTNAIPERMIPFDKAVGSSDYDQWVHFYIHDAQFMRLFRNPWRYLPVLQKFKGAISPDFSIFWNYEKYLQIQSVGRSREIGAWLQRNGVPVIPNVRWGKKDTYGYAFDGIERGGTVAVGTAGCMREKKIRTVFENGFYPMLKAIQPKTIIVYGSRRSEVFANAEKLGIKVVAFQTDTSKAFKKKES